MDNRYTITYKMNKPWVITMDDFIWLCSPRSHGCIEVSLDLENLVFEKMNDTLLHEMLARVLNMPSKCSSEGLLDRVAQMRIDLRDYREWFQSIVSPDGVINGYWKEFGE